MTKAGRQAGRQAGIHSFGTPATREPSCQRITFPLHVPTVSTHKHTHMVPQSCTQTHKDTWAHNPVYNSAFLSGSYYTQMIKLIEQEFIIKLLSTELLQLIIGIV